MSMEPADGNGAHSNTYAVIERVGRLDQQYRLPALEDFRDSTRRFAGERAVNVAILGRLKAGKTACFSALAGRPLLPVGVTPVTCVVTVLE